MFIEWSALQFNYGTEWIKFKLGTLNYMLFVLQISKNGMLLCIFITTANLSLPYNCVASSLVYPQFEATTAMTRKEKLKQSLLAHVPRETVNQFLSRDKTPISVLLLSSLVGVLAGCVATLFELGVHFVSETRTDWLRDEIVAILPLWLSAFLISALLAFVGYFLVQRFAPEAAGSGIPEIEGAMDNIRPVRWWRVLPVKFFGGLGALGSGMVLGREGPTVQMGGNIVFRAINRQHVVITMPQYATPDLHVLWLFLRLGALFGLFGVIFNRLITLSQDMFFKLHRNNRGRYLFTGTTFGGVFGLLLLYVPELTNGGVNLIPQITNGTFSTTFLLMLFINRIITTLICFASGAPGGIFAPMLTLGTSFGYAFGLIVKLTFPDLPIEPGMLAIAGMGAPFATTVSAPITCILLVIEMTNNYDLILPLIITTLGATILAQSLAGQPIYSQILHRTIRNKKLRQADCPTNQS
jgi:CIC family chloride channel protein